MLYDAESLGGLVLVLMFVLVCWCWCWCWQCWQRCCPTQLPPPSLLLARAPPMRTHTQRLLRANDHHSCVAQFRSADSLLMRLALHGVRERW